MNRSKLMNHINHLKAEVTVLEGRRDIRAEMKKLDAILVYDSKKDKFRGVMNLYDFLKHYGSPPKGIGSIQKATVGDCASTNIISISWDDNVSQTWAKINKYKPKGILLHDKDKEFVGYLSNKDLWNGLEQISSMEDED